MKLVKVFVMTACTLFLLTGCSGDFSKYTGSYRYISKVDSHDNSETVYKKESRRYNSAIKISLDGDNLSAVTVNLDKEGNSSLLKNAKSHILNRTDDGIFQYKSENGSPVFTFIFSDNTLMIHEYAKDKYGNIKEESRTVLNKL